MNRNIILIILLSFAFMQGKINGYAIFDYKGSTQQFDVDRAYLIYSKDISDDLFFKYRLDVGRDSDSDGDFCSDVVEAGLSDPDGDGFLGFIHQCVIDFYLSKHDSPEDIEVYFCGPPMMNQAVEKMADDFGIPPENVRFDDFGG